MLKHKTLYAYLQNNPEAMGEKPKEEIALILDLAQRFSLLGNDGFPLTSQNLAYITGSFTTDIFKESINAKLENLRTKYISQLEENGLEAKSIDAEEWTVWKSAYPVITKFIKIKNAILVEEQGTKSIGDFLARGLQGVNNAKTQEIAAFKVTLDMIAKGIKNLEKVNTGQTLTYMLPKYLGEHINKMSLADAYKAQVLIAQQVDFTDDDQVVQDRLIGLKKIDCQPCQVLRCGKCLLAGRMSDEV